MQEFGHDMEQYWDFFQISSAGLGSFRIGIPGKKLLTKSEFVRIFRMSFTFCYRFLGLASAALLGVENKN